jgi:hypothetical protein
MTGILAGQPSMHRFGILQAKATSTARSAQPSLGRATCRRKTAIPCRSTRISVSFAASLRDRSTSQLNTRAMNM